MNTNDELKKLVLDNISDLCTDFLYYDRKEDQDLDVETLNLAFETGAITIDEAVAEFRKALVDTLPAGPPAAWKPGDQFPGSGIQSSFTCDMMLPCHPDFVGASLPEGSITKIGVMRETPDGWKFVEVWPNEGDTMDPEDLLP